MQLASGFMQLAAAGHIGATKYISTVFLKGNVNSALQWGKPCSKFPNILGGSRGEGFPDSPGKSQVTICFLKNNGTDLLENPLDPLGPMDSRGRSVPPTVKVNY